MTNIRLHDLLFCRIAVEVQAGLKGRYLAMQLLKAGTILKDELPELMSAPSLKISTQAGRGACMHTLSCCIVSGEALRSARQTRDDEVLFCIRRTDPHGGLAEQNSKVGTCSGVLNQRYNLPGQCRHWQMVNQDGSFKWGGNRS